VPAYFITANLHYAMLTASDPRLAAVNEAAAFIVADGMPLVWAARLSRRPLPERGAGGDLVPALRQRAAQPGYRVLLLGGPAWLSAAAAQRLCRSYPSLQLVGFESPPFRTPSPEEHVALLARIRMARPDLLFVAFGQPKGEFWIAENYQSLGVPVVVQIG